MKQISKLDYMETNIKPDQGLSIDDFMKHQQMEVNRKLKNILLQ